MAPQRWDTPAGSAGAHGPWCFVVSRFARWQKAGVCWRSLTSWQQVEGAGQRDGTRHRGESPLIRAHQHAAGVPKGTRRPQSGRLPPHNPPAGRGPPPALPVRLSPASGDPAVSAGLGDLDPESTQGSSHVVRLQKLMDCHNGRDLQRLLFPKPIQRPVPGNFVQTACGSFKRRPISHQQAYLVCHKFDPRHGPKERPFRGHLTDRKWASHGCPKVGPVAAAYCRSMVRLAICLICCAVSGPNFRLIMSK
jgi:hypothetical protein